MSERGWFGLDGLPPNLAITACRAIQADRPKAFTRCYISD